MAYSIYTHVAHTCCPAHWNAACKPVSCYIDFFFDVQANHTGMAAAADPMAPMMSVPHQQSMQPQAAVMQQQQISQLSQQSQQQQQQQQIGGMHHTMMYPALGAPGAGMMASNPSLMVISPMGLMPPRSMPMPKSSPNVQPSIPMHMSTITMPAMHLPATQFADHQSQPSTNQRQHNFLPTVAPSNVSSSAHNHSAPAHADQDYRLSTSPEEDFHDPQDDFESGEHKPYIPAAGPIEHPSKPGDFEFGAQFVLFC